MKKAFFSRGDAGWFLPNDACRGPWDPDSCHAGPPTGLLVRAMELALAQVGSTQRLCRITAELIRPVPMAGFFVQAEIVRPGRSLSTLKARIVDATGKERTIASGIAMRADLNRALPTLPRDTPMFASSDPGEFVFTRALHDKPCFTQAIEMRYPHGESNAPGPTAVWMRAPPLLDDEPSSPFQRICPLADCGNAISRNAEPWEVGFVNADLTVVLHREPAGEWLGTRSRSHWQPTGIGLAQATLFDDAGAVGEALQTLLLSPQD